MRVVIWSNISRHMPGWPEAIDLLGRAGHEVVDPGSKNLAEDQADLLRDADGLLAGTNKITRSMLEMAPLLKVIAKPGVGVDNIDLDAANDLGIRVCNTPGVNADVVADHTIALALALMRDLVPLDRSVRSGQGWTVWPFVGRQLAGSSVAVLGTGHIGSAVVKRLVAGFGAHVTAYDARPDADLQARYGVAYGPLSEVIRGVDLVTVHLPLSADTTGIIGAPELALLPATALLVNASRGGVVDEAALVEAIEAGRLAGAGVDVFSTEPAVNNVMFGNEHILLTPHVAGYSIEASVRSRVVAAENVVCALAGQPQHQVNERPAEAPGTWRSG